MTSNVTELRSTRQKFGTVTPHFKDPIVFVRPELIRETAPTNCVGFLGGQSGAMKTFMSVHLSMCIITGREFAGRKIEKPGGVAFVAAEGKASIAGRLKAARRQFGIDPESQIPFVTITDFEPLDRDSAFTGLETRLSEIAGVYHDKFGVPLVATFIDTVQAAGMIGVDQENDPATWSKLFQRLRGIAERVGVTIFLIHHYGKAASAGLRGSSDARASADFVLALTCERNEVTGESDNRFLALTKNRDGYEGPIGAVAFETVEIARRDDGSPVTTLTVSVNTERRLVDTGKAGRESRALSTFRSALADALIDRGEDVRIDGEHDAPLVKAVDMSVVYERFEAFYVTAVTDEKKRADLLKKQFKNGFEEAQRRQLIAAKTWRGIERVWMLRNERNGAEYSEYSETDKTTAGGV